MAMGKRKSKLWQEIKIQGTERARGKAKGKARGSNSMGFWILLGCSLLVNVGAACVLCGAWSVWAQRYREKTSALHLSVEFASDEDKACQARPVPQPAMLNELLWQACVQAGGQAVVRGQAQQSHEALVAQAQARARQQNVGMMGGVLRQGVGSIFGRGPF